MEIGDHPTSDWVVGLTATLFSLAVVASGMATVQYYDGSSFVDLDKAAWEVEQGTSTQKIAPSATVVTLDDAIETNTEVRIRDKPNNRTIFGGYAASSGDIDAAGQRTIDIEGYGVALMREEVTVTTLPGDTDSFTLSQTLTATSRGSDFTLDFQPAPQTLSGGFDISQRIVGDVFREICELRDYVFWISPDKTITVQLPGGRGSIGSVTIGTDAAQLNQYESGNVRTISNKIIVKGKGANASVEATATDSTSISTYGEQPQTVTSAWVADKTDAQNLADSLLQPTPVPSGTLEASPTLLGNQYDTLVNYQVDVTDSNRGLSSQTLTIQAQTISEGTDVLEVGAGSGIDIGEVNRKRRSQDDSGVVDLDDVPNSDDYARIAANSVTATDEILADAVNLEDDLGNLARSLQDLAVDDSLKNRTVLDGSEVLTGSISKDEITASTITAGEIDSNTITASEIAGGTITAGEIESNTITANEVAADTLTANEISAGSISARELQISNWIPIGLSFSDNSPSSGEISWNSHELVHDGTTYNISSGSTAREFVYWTNGSTSYSTSDTQPTLGSDDALIAVNDNGAAVQIIQATIIDGGSIRTNSIEASEIAAGSITANEIAADSITANEIDTLSLTTGELEITSSSTTDAITFDVVSFLGLDFVTMEPSGDAGIGVSTPFGFIRSEDLEAQQVAVGSSASVPATDGNMEIYPSNASDPIKIDAGDGTNQTIRPESNNFGRLGTGDGSAADTAWFEIHTNNLYQYSPAPVQSDESPGPNHIDRDELKASTWDDPPEYVGQRKVVTERNDDGEPTAVEHERLPEGGMEMGALSNYLLEVCKEQDRIIDDLRESVGDLTQRVERLEQQADPNA